MPKDLSPRGLDFDLSLLSLLEEASHTLGELSGVGGRLANPRLLVQPLLRREAVLSSRIEGTEADLGDLYHYEAGGQASLPGFRPSQRDDAREVFNYVTALEAGLSQLSETPLSLRLIRELHKRLMSGVRGKNRAPGQFRTIQNWIGPAGCTLDDATYVPPPPAEMIEALGKLEQFIHDDRDSLPLLIKLALVHYQFEAIHPFLDGNGRIGRLLMVLLLVHWNQLPIPLLYLSPYFERHKQEYYERLLRASTHSEVAEWTAFFLRGVSAQAIEAAQLVRRLQELQANWHQRVTGSRNSSLLIRLIDQLFETPLTTIPRVAKVLGVSYNSAHRSIEKLLDAEILAPVFGSTHPKWFMAIGVVNAVSEPGAPE